MIARWWKSGATPILLLGALLLSACAGALPSGAVEIDSSDVSSPETAGSEDDSSADFNVDFSFLGEAFETEDLHWTGMVESIATTQWTISGIVLSVDEASEIDSGIALGDPAEVEAAFLPDGRLYAREIRIPAASSTSTQGSEVEFVGLAEIIAADSWTVAGMEVAIAEQTEIQGPLAAGDLVKVHALVSPDGKLSAREIESAAAELADDEFVDEVEFTGTVESISDSLWLIGGRTVLISARTETGGGLAVGDLVKVHGVYDSEGKLVAREIELEDNEGHQAREGEMDFTGIVQALSATSITIDGKVFTLTPQSEVEGSMVVGDLVKVHVFVAADGTLTVREVELHDETMDDDDSSDDIGDDDMEDDPEDGDSGNDDSGDEVEGDDADGDDNS